MSNDHRAGAIGCILRFHRDARVGLFFETIGAPASGDFGERR
jgi:hypothetical protein